MVAILSSENMCYSGTKYNALCNTSDVVRLIRVVEFCFLWVQANMCFHFNMTLLNTTFFYRCLKFTQPLKDGDRGSYSHFLDHKRPTRTPRVNVCMKKDCQKILNPKEGSLTAGNSYTQDGIQAAMESHQE